MKILLNLSVDKMYLDMDGVLANFEGARGKNEHIDDFLNRFKTEKGFFANLTPIATNVACVREWLQRDNRNIHIISAAPNKQADSDKMEWLRKHLPELRLENIIICRNGEDKSKFIENIERSILIDDYSVNLTQWQAAGGYAIKFVNDYDDKRGTHTKYNIPYVTSFDDIAL